MFKKIPDTGETIVAEAAAVGLRSGMGQKMSDQIISAGKRFVTFITLVGLRVSVHSLVHGELILTGETGITIVALVTLFIDMVDHVGVQRCLRQVQSATLAAFEFLLGSTLGLDVNFQLRC